MNVLITGAGSVMGQSIFKALDHHDFGRRLNVHFANSDTLGAGRYFTGQRSDVVATPLFPLARDPQYDAVLDDYVRQNGIDIVYAGTQHELAKICEWRERTGRAATLTSSIADICLDKVKTAEVLGRHGVRVPRTQPLDQYLAAPSIEGPVIVKPNASSASRNIRRFENHEACLAAMSSGAPASLSMLVQETLLGSEYTVGCYVDRYGQGLSTICFRRTLTPDGATFHGEIVAEPAIEAYVRSVGAALVREGMEFGHVNVQLIVDPLGPCLFEINGRLSSTEAPKAHFGFNSCAAYATNIVLGRPYTALRPASSGQFLRYYDEVYF